MPTVERPTEAQQAYQQIREAILRGELLPGQRLVEKDLAERYNLGRAAIRSALTRLQQEGLVDSEAYRGAWVRVVSVEEALEILEARMVLESLAARYAAQKAGPRDVARLNEILELMRIKLQEGDLLGISELNSLLHQTLLGISGHKTVQRLVEALRAQVVRHQFRTILVPGRSQRSLEEHQRIVEAVAAHDAEGAEKAMRVHLEGVIAALQQASRGVDV
ncbi:GntR family transcriptional regulator [Thermus caldifontis]|uniref:GntR family transcriptional regulator n=1 Tax=Thermus caldifontis TaxID=1930763 RepID=UPI000DF1FB7A|nr:GntR family transcriptional regulator [Thermus caldifontis]